VQRTLENVDLFPEVVNLSASRTGIGSGIEPQSARRHPRSLSRQDSLKQTGDGSTESGRPIYVRNGKEFKFGLGHEVLHKSANCTATTFSYGTGAASNPAPVAKSFKAVTVPGLIEAS
jgi:hypothetical protein